MTITGGTSPGPRGPISLRNPLEGATKLVAGNLKTCLEKGLPIRIAQNGDLSHQMFDVSWTRRPNPDFPPLEYKAIVDPGMGWNVTSLRVGNQRGNIFQEHEVEYKESRPASNEWIPVKGVSRRLTEIRQSERDPYGKPLETRIPPSEDRFECLEYRNNDSKFPERIFDIILKEGTYVYDQRHQASYRVRDDEVITPDK